jgi:hypothetical protein
MIRWMPFRPSFPLTDWSSRRIAELIYTYDTQGERTGITGLLGELRQAGIRFKDLNTTQSSLEEIFVSLVKKPA